MRADRGAQRAADAAQGQCHLVPDHGALPPPGLCRPGAQAGPAALAPQDVVYCTRLTGPELARFRIPSAEEAASGTAYGDYGEQAWPTPELPHRAQQMFIEPVLRAQAERHASAVLRFGLRAEAVQDTGCAVQIECREPDTGRTELLQAAYVVGCDGPRSLVRQAMGVVYAGHGSERRDFLGGPMMSIYFRAPGLYGLIGKPRAWQYWAVGPGQRGLLCAIDGVDRFVLIVQLPQGTQPADFHPQQALQAVVGRPFAHELIALTPGTRAMPWWPSACGTAGCSSPAMRRTCSRPRAAWATTPAWTTS